MPERKFSDAEDKRPAITLRRSPRFLQQRQNLVVIAETSNPANTRSSRSSPISINISPLKTKRKSNAGLRSGDRKGTECENWEKYNKRPRISYRSQNGSQLSGKEEALVSHYVIEKRVTRSSARGKGWAGGKDNACVFDEGSVKSVTVWSKEGNGVGGLNLYEQRVGNIEKRVTRSESRAVALNKASKVVNGNFGKVVMWDERKLKGGVICLHDQDLGMKGAAKKRATRRSSLVEFNSSNVVGQRLPNVAVSNKKNVNRDVIRGKPGFEKRVTRGSSKNSETNAPDFSIKKVNKVEKRITRCSTRKDVVETASSLVETSCKVSMSKERKFEDMSRRDAQEFGGNRIHEEIDFVDGAKGGEKRKSHQVDVEKENGCGWTVEQQLALRRAYFTAKPTPHFWKKVAKMVPGKSAEDCFEKIQSDHQTPPQPRTRLRARKKKLSPIPCSASKLLTPADAKSKKLKPRKMNVLLAQKTVRHLLQKHQDEDKDCGLDLFALLEPSANDNPSSPNIQECATFDSPSPLNQEEPRVLTKCRGTSDSSASKKQKSRLSNTSFLSPPVLKQIKNKALHEKYIDQLHRRDAKRKAESRRNAKSGQGQRDDEKSNHLKENAVKVARDALAFDALDAVSKLRSLQSDGTDSPDDDYDTTDRSDEQE